MSGRASGRLDGMEATDVLALLRALDGKGVVYWLDGGWGVDCLLGEQTRPHSDLDLVLHRKDVAGVSELLTTNGYEVIRDWLPTSLAFRGPGGREVDLHPVDPSEHGGCHQVLSDGTRWHYNAPVAGAIAGVTVYCASAEDQLLMHQGYEPREVDFADMRRLAVRFRLTLPGPFG